MSEPIASAVKSDRTLHSTPRRVWKYYQAFEGAVQADMTPSADEGRREVAVGRARLERATPGLKGLASNPDIPNDITSLGEVCIPTAPRIAPRIAASTPDPVTRALIHAARSWIGERSIVSLRRNLLELLVALEDDQATGTITTTATPRKGGD
jgi:hypothetical protein